MADNGGLGKFFWGMATGTIISAPIASFITSKVMENKARVLEEKNEMMRPTQVKTEEPVVTPTLHVENNQVVSSEPEDIPTTAPDIDIDNFDIEIDDEEATEDSLASAEEHEKIFDMIEKYRGEDGLSIHIIDGDKFNVDYRYQKSYVNYYEDDNVFEEGLNAIKDPYVTFGVTNGKDLFAHGAIGTDPDIVYVRNEKTSTDYEVTRTHGSYKELVGDEYQIGQIGQTDQG